MARLAQPVQASHAREKSGHWPGPKGRSYQLAQWGGRQKTIRNGPETYPSHTVNTTALQYLITHAAVASREIVTVELHGTWQVSV